MSTSPTSSASRPIASKSARSAATKRPLPPASSSSATVSAPRAGSRPLTTTSAPRAASCLATSRPIPEVPPVTNAVLPSNSMLLPFVLIKVDCAIQTGTDVLDCQIQNECYRQGMGTKTETPRADRKQASDAAPRLTRKGAETRERIVTAAAELVFADGVAETSIEDVKEKAGVSSSQLYHYFADKQALIHAVIAHQSDAVIAAHEPLLAKLDSPDALRAWRDQAVAIERQLHCKGGCPIGTLAGELAEADPEARADIAKGFARWEEQIAQGLAAMPGRGELPAG